MQRYDRGFGAAAFRAINAGLMVLVVLATLYPLYYVFIVSISDANSVIRGDIVLYPRNITWQSYRLVLGTSTIMRSLSNSIMYTVIGTLINLVMTALCAYPLARSRFSGRTIFTIIITVTMFFSGGLIPLYLLILQLGLRNTIWSLVLPVAISPWNMIIMRTYFQGIPEEMFEAATIDGANDLQILARIVVPLSKPIFATLLLYYAVGHWNQWFNALIFLDDRSRFPIQLILRSIVVQGQLEQGGQLMSPSAEEMIVEKTIKYATIIVSTVPILVVYPFVQKYFVQGVMIGAIKG